MAEPPDRARAEAAVQQFLQALGLWSEQLSETPSRVVSAFTEELLSGYATDVPSLIEAGSEAVTEPRPGAVLVDDMRVVTVCPHHLLVARGRADVAYVPGTRLLGLGTLSRLVNAFTRRLTLQEAIAPQVVDALMSEAGARGALCRLRFDHACLQARGPEQDQAQAVTWASAGELADLSLLERLWQRPDSEKS